MKKLLILALCFVFALSANAQELIVIGGGGFNKIDTIAKGDFGFAQARLMFPLTPGLRVGPYLGYTQYSNMELNKTPNSVLLGKEFSYGVSFDSYGHVSYSYSYYFWVNGGGKNVTDRFKDNLFESTTKTKEMFVEGGFFLTDDWKSWFGNNSIMFGYQRPISSEIRATLSGEKVLNLKPYNKESFRIVLESRIKRFGEKTLTIEPLIHVGYGNNFGSKKEYYELGGGISLGIFKDYYRDILKIKAFHREDFDGKTPGGLCGEIIFNVSSLVQALRK